MFLCEERETAHNGLVAGSSRAGPTNGIISLRLARQVLFEVHHRFDHQYMLLAILRRNRGCGLEMRTHDAATRPAPHMRQEPSGYRHRRLPLVGRPPALGEPIEDVAGRDRRTTDRRPARANPTRWPLRACPCTCRSARSARYGAAGAFRSRSSDPSKGRGGRSVPLRSARRLLISRDASNQRVNKG